jgi:hypothetical protein
MVASVTSRVFAVAHQLGLVACLLAMLATELPEPAALDYRAAALRMGAFLGF